MRAAYEPLCLQTGVRDCLGQGTALDPAWSTGTDMNIKARERKVSMSGWCQAWTGSHRL